MVSLFYINGCYGTFLNVIETYGKIYIGVSASKHGVVTNGSLLDILEKLDIKEANLMSRTSQESSTAFGEVLRPASQNYSHNPQGRIVSNDNRLMIYSQGMKIYVPEDFNPGTLLKLLQTLKKL